MGWKRARWCAVAIAIALVVTGVIIAPAARGAQGAGPTITELDVAGLMPSSGPSGITDGPDGNQWISLSLANEVGRLTPSGQFTTFPLGTSVNANASGIVSGPDGQLWIAGPAANALVKVSTAGVATVVTPVASAAFAGPEQLAVGRDGAVWFTERNANTIGRITIDGTVTEFPYATTLPPPAINAGASGITRGGDGNIWISTADQVARFDVTTEAFTFFVAPGAGGSANAVTLGGDGNVWSTGAGHVFRITPAGVVTPFPAPSGRQIVLGPDGYLWYTASDRAGFVRVGTDGSTTSFTDGLRTPSTDLGPLSSGPGSTIWFVHQLDAGVGRIDDVVAPATTTTTTTTITTTTSTTTIAPAPATAVSGTPSFAG